MIKSNQYNKYLKMSNNLLQKSYKELRCQVEGHQDEPLNYICITVDCQKDPIMCYLCSLQNHIDHEKIVLKVFLKKLVSIQANSQKLIPLCAQIDNSLKSIQGKLEAYSKHFVNNQLILKTFQQWRTNNIKYTLNFYELIQKVADLFSIKQQQEIVNKLNKFIKEYYFKYFAQIPENEWSKLNISQHILIKKIDDFKSIMDCLQKLKTTHKLNDTDVLNLFPLAIQQVKKIKVVFSQELKPDVMTIVSPTQAKIQKAGSQRLIILEPCLSKTMSVKKWCVKIIKLASWIGVGVCHINEIKKANYMFNYTNTGHGSYLISSNGYSWSSYKKQYNSHFESFSFTTGDVIHVQYDPKEHYVHFRKESDPNAPTYKLEVQSNDDPIHPEINMTGVGDEVQIINY